MWEAGGKVERHRVYVCACVCDAATMCLCACVRLRVYVCKKERIFDCLRVREGV